MPTRSQDRVQAAARDYALYSDDYEEFCRKLQEFDDPTSAAAFDDDEEDFVADEFEFEEDDFDPLLFEPEPNLPKTPVKEDTQEDEDNAVLPSPAVSVAPDFYKELEEEIEQLQTEDMEAAVASLIDQQSREDGVDPSPASDIPPSTPLRDAARAPQTAVTDEQYDHLDRLMKQHYQVLVQQLVMSVRSVNAQRTHQPRTPETCTLESHDDLVDIMDVTVNMLQDLRNNQMDAVRRDLQRRHHQQNTRRSLFSNNRLTRAQFKTLAPVAECDSIFNIPGLTHLPSTFCAIEQSVKDIVDRSGSEHIGTIQTQIGCQKLLKEVGAEINEDVLPGRDVSTAFCDVREFLGPDFEAPCSLQEQVVLRKNRNLFSSAEDNLVLRGVNLYGEKQWSLISDRYLPDRSVNVISQRYNKLSLMIYKANGIEIAEDGSLVEPLKMESVDDLDEEELTGIRKVPPPAVLNVHRWSMEEDLTLLRTVPKMGNMWAELGARFIPHRDRGHLRKRYQVLQRRVKATVGRTNRQDFLRIPKWPASPSASKSSPLSTSSSPGSPTRSPRPRPLRGKVGKSSPHRKLPARQVFTTSKEDTDAAAILAGARSQTPKRPLKSSEASRRSPSDTLDEDESEVANAMSQLSKSPAKPPLHPGAPEATNMSTFLEEPSGLSVFANAAFSPEKRTRPAQSLMAGVLERSKRGSGGNMAPPLPSTDAIAFPRTPSRKPSNDSAEPMPGTTPLSLNASPGDLSSWKGANDGSTIGANTIDTLSGVGDSRMIHSGATGSLDGYNYRDVFHRSPHGSLEGSGDHSNGYESVFGPGSTSNTSASATGLGNESLENDAISALSRLSNSPAKRPNAKRKAEDTDSSSRKKSLFATVVGEKAGK